MAEFGTVSSQRMALQRFWRGLVKAATEASVQGAKHVDITNKACVEDIETWVFRLIPELQTWNTTHRKLGDLNSRIATLRKLPKQVGGCKADQAKFKMIKRLTSVSLFRLRPFRRTMLWYRHHNSFLPDAYIRDRLENMEASLPSGEAAFVAFAGGRAAHQAGIVIGDCKEDLRSTYPLIDRAIGLRSNAIVPIRQSERGVILALIMVSLPFANAFEPKFLNVLRESFHHFEDQLELLWEFEQLRESREFDEKDYSARVKDEFRQIILDLTPDAYSGGEAKDDQARLPGCAILEGQASGGGQMAASVEINSAQVAVSPQHEALFAQSELELGSYGVRDRWFTTDDLSLIGTFGQYSLWYGPREERQPKFPDSLASFGVLQLIGDAAALAFKRGGKASLMHRRLDTQRLLFSYTLDYLTSGHSARLAAVINEIRAIYAGVKDPIDLEQISGRLEEVRNWVVTQREAIRFLCISIDASVLALNYSATDTYLSGFRVLGQNDASPHSLSEKPDHPHLTDIAHELSGVRRFIALCRGLTALVTTSVPANDFRKFRIKNFGIYPKETPDKPCAYLPTTLLTHRSRLIIERQENSVNITIIDKDKCRLESSWQILKSFLPLATSALAPLMPESQPLFLPLSGLPLKEQVLFFDLRRARVGAARSWHLKTTAKCRPVAKLVQLLAKQMPEWVASMDCLAVVPLPHREGLNRPSFYEWAQGRGERRLLVAGILRRTIEEDVWGDSDIDLVSDGDPRLKEDPFLERFWKLLNGIQRRQGILRQLEKLKQNETILAHLSHDLCSKENIAILQRVLNTQQFILLPHKHNAPEFRPKDLANHLKQLAEAQVFGHDLNLLRVLSTLDTAVIHRSPTLSELTSDLARATVSAIRHATRRIWNQSQVLISAESLTDLLKTDLLDVTDLKMRLRNIRSESYESSPLLFVHALLDNILRNAFENAWSFGSDPQRGTVRIEERPTDSCLAIANDAESGRWEGMEELYKTANDNLGIKIIRSIADRLNLTIAIKVNSATNGEIQLIVER